MDGNQEQSSNLSTVKHDQSSSISHKNENEQILLSLSIHSKPLRKILQNQNLSIIGIEF